MENRPDEPRLFLHGEYGKMLVGMNADETDLGGARRDFPDTTAGFISRICRADHPERQRGLEELCRRYWKPVYVYVRLTRGKTIEDAKDLTQAFFAWLMEGGVLEKYEPERSGFRHYLKGVLRRFASDHERALHRLKRGGGVRVIAIDEVAALEAMIAAPGAADPDKTFDQAWAVTISKRAIDRVRERFLENGKELSFRIFEEHVLTPSEEAPKLADMARRLGLDEAAARKHLFVVREAVRGEIRAELAEMARDERDLEDEWNVLFNGG
ncbi:MAG: sigma-70 family RNA polymerase sigma factor [Planctomycetes bacterium]|nr:sigma-70 family RNA polymerase sigma factor [Planctomycetota bacterium]